VLLTSFTVIMRYFRHMNNFMAFITFGLMFSTFSAYSINNPLKFEHISTEQGLSQPYVFSIVQDLHGFMWIATQDGLNRYDGKKFKQYRHNNADPHSVADNYITKVFVDRAGTLWVGTKNGLSRYDQELDRFDNFYAQGNENSLRDNVIWTIYQDNANLLWVSTALGLQTFDPTKQQFTQINIKNGNNTFVEVKTIFQDHDNTYWIGTYEHGIYLINDNKSYAVSLQAHNKWQLIINTKALFDIKRIDKNYWLATDTGVYVINQNYKIIKHYQHTEQATSLSSNQIRAIVQADDTHVWLGTYEKGLNIINLLDDSIEHFTSEQYPKALADNWIWTIYKDQQANIWLGTVGKGISIYKAYSSLFHHEFYSTDKNINSFVSLLNNNLWFSSSAEIYQKMKNHNYSPLPLKLSSPISRFLRLNARAIVIFLKNGNLLEINPVNYKLDEHLQWLQKSKSINYQDIYPSNDKLWYISQSGDLTSYDLKQNSFKSYLNQHSRKFVQLSNITKSIIWLIDKQGGIYTFNTATNQFDILTLPTIASSYLNKITNLTVSQHWIWLSSEQGILLINKATGTKQLFDENNGLINNFVNSVLIDDNENAWLATNNGISVISPVTQKVKNFGADFGLTDNNFLKGSALKDSNNLFYFGGLNGFQQFDPSEVLRVTQTLPKPVLNNLLIANKPIDIDNNKIVLNDKTKKFTIDKNINDLTTLTLAYNQSPFTLEFIAPNVKLPAQTRYRYKLQGLEQHWIESGVGNYRATYTNLDAGDYIFKIQAYDLYNPKINATKQLRIHILPPWWLSNSAIAFYSLIVLLIIGYILLQTHHRRQFHLQIQQSEERLKLSLWGSGDEMWDWNIKSGKIYRSNIWGMLDFPRDGTRNKNAAHTPETTNIHPQDLTRVQDSLKHHFEHQTEYFEETYRVKNKHGEWIWILDRGKVVDRDEQGAPLRMTGTLKDISQIKKTEERLKLFAKSIANISDAVAIYDEQFNAVEINKAYIRTTGKAKSQVIGKPFNFNQYPESYTNSVKKQIAINKQWHGEIEDKRANGEVYLTDVNIDVICNENNEITHYVSVFSDITERKKNEEELRKLANSDTLTGLPNRSYFQAKHTHLVNYKTPHALLVFDLDNFKKINDSLGHEVGDTLLCRVAQRIIAAARSQDTICRLGGDEFSLIIENTNDIYTITSIAKNILRKIAEPLRLTNQEVVLFSSIGIVLYPEDGASPQELLKNADTAMYHAKNLGGNRYQFFNDSMNKQAVKRLQVENLIRFGLKEDYFTVYYQPKIEIATGKIAGMEALVRFEHPRKGIISPAVFIPVSEETGQIIGIGEVVLRKACFATKRWLDAGLFDGRVAVNLSAVQFTQPNLVELIATILQESRLPAKHLELEITEGTVMDSPQAAIDIMLQIRAMGIHLSLDDFGTGYSSLAYLKKFPLNTLKIDKAFVDDIEHSEQGRNMVATIITIAHNLGLHVVAEGVEHSKQLDFLASLHCEQLQGFLYSRPLSEHDFKQYLSSAKIADKSALFTRL